MSDMRILTLDIETSPNLVYAWGLFNQFIGIDMIVKPTGVICWAAKWLGEKKVYYRDFEDEDFLTKIYDLVDSADAVVHYNGTSFDMRYLNMEFVRAGMTPPFTPKNIDLLRTVKRRFRFPSNKLDYVAGELLDEKKAVLPRGFELWWNCLVNNYQESWDMMKKYNIQDVRLTEKLYILLRPWIPGHPNHGLYVKDQKKPVCRACGSSKVQQRGWQALNVASYLRYKCMACGWNGRGRYRVKGGKDSPQVLS
jgi:DNA polymerase elongation subunit (family B)